MRPEELFIGAIIKFPHGVDKVVDLPYIEGRGICASFAASATLFPTETKLLAPIDLTTDILERNGWFYKNGIWVKLGAPRMGWYEKEKTLIIGFTTFPIVVEHVHRMQAIQRILGAEELTL